jgi:hypothetical protein
MLKSEIILTLSRRDTQEFSDKVKARRLLITVPRAASTPNPVKEKRKMQAKTKTKAPARKEQKRDPLAPFREQAEPIIRLYFSDSTPGFVRDLLSSWLSEIENETQVFWNRREILTVALPLMLREADAQGLDVLSRDGGFYLSALRDAAGCIESGIEHKREPTEREVLERELERDAAALARLLNSPHVPKQFKNDLGEIYMSFTTELSEAEDVVKAAWPVAVRASIEKKGGE